MSFQPSDHSYGDYGWSSAFPLSTLTVSSTGTKLGLSNQPTSSAHKANLSLLSDFLAKLPFPVRVSSGYRSYAVNKAVGGSSSSQHPNGLAVDFTPTTMSNKDAATWLYENLDDFPELDQVIWYSDTTHVHVGICPSGATNCPRSSGPRREFLKARKEGSTYTPWAPTAAEQVAMAAKYVYHRPFKSAGVLWAASVVGGGVAMLVLLAVVRVRRKRKGG